MYVCRMCGAGGTLLCSMELTCCQCCSRVRVLICELHVAKLIVSVRKAQQYNKLNSGHLKRRERTALRTRGVGVWPIS